MALLPVAIGVMAAGGLTSAYGAYTQGEHQAEAARRNADAQRIQGQLAVQEAQRQEQLQREKAARLMSKQRAMYGSSGAEMTGSPLEVMADQAYQNEMDALAIRHQGALERWKYDTAAENSEWMAGNYSSAGKISAASTLLTTGGNAMMAGSKGGLGGKKKPVMDGEDLYLKYFMGRVA